jgi:transcriptional regulator with XRE-family HTH domain
MVIEFKKAVGNRMRFARDEAGLTTAELAEIMDLPVITVRSHLRGDNLPDFETMVRYADAFKVDIGLLRPARPKGFEPLTFWSDSESETEAAA